MNLRKRIRNIIIATCDSFHSHAKSFENGTLSKGHMTGDFDWAENAILKACREAVPKSEIQFLTKDRLVYQMGWCDGRNKLRQQCLENMK